MRLITILFILIFASPSWGAVIFSDNFDSDADWSTPTYNQNCSSSCGMPGGWDGYYNWSLCTSAIPGYPGNKLGYIATGSGYGDYPTETGACHSGTKCLTHWQESCSAVYDQSNLNLFKDTGTEYNDVYLGFWIKFKPNFEFMDGALFKVFHIQHFDTGVIFWQYFEVDTRNQPLLFGQFYATGGSLYFQMQPRCQIDYDGCHNVITYGPIGTIANLRSSGILDGNWHSLVFEARNNTGIGVADGQANLWIDDVPISTFSGYTNTDIPYNDTGSPGMRGFRGFTISGNANNQWDTSCGDMADCEQWYSIDGVSFATTYTGAISAGSSDTTAPIFSGGYPSSNQNCTPHRNLITIGGSTDENATCRYSTLNVPYDSMALTFGGAGTTAHSVAIIPNLCDYTYTYYVQCTDTTGNKTTTATPISFYVTPQFWKRGHSIEIR